MVLDSQTACSFIPNFLERSSWVFQISLGAPQSASPLDRKGAEKWCFLRKEHVIFVQKVTDLEGTPLYGQEEGVTVLGVKIRK